MELILNVFRKLEFSSPLKMVSAESKYICLVLDSEKFISAVETAIKPPVDVPITKSNSDWTLHIKIYQLEQS